MKKIVLIIIGVLLIGFLVYQKQDSARLLFVGDTSFDRYIRQVSMTKGEDFIFSCIGDFLKDADLVVSNLEGPITDNPSISLGTEIGSPNNYVFTFPPSTGKLLKRYNMKLVNLGNNHTDDFGEEGMVSTKKYLDKSGVDYFGSFDKDGPVHRLKLGGLNMSFVSYNQFSGNSPEEVAEKISEEAGAGRTVIVYAHWGEEYSPVTPYMKDISNLFARSGAKVIIGSHPHIVLQSEKIGDTVVYYSLGNFIFDQYWNLEVRTGLVLEMTVKNKQIEITEHKVALNEDGRTCLVTD